MVLSGSGQLSFNQIQIELDRTSDQANFSLASASLGLYAAINTGNPVADRPDQVAPHAVTEWYSYDHDFASITYSIDLTYENGTGGFILNSNAAVAVEFEIGESITVDGFDNMTCTTGGTVSSTLSGFALVSGSSQNIEGGSDEPGMGTKDYFKFTYDTTVLVSINSGTATNRTSGDQWNEGGYNWKFTFDNNCNLNFL